MFQLSSRPQPAHQSSYSEEMASYERRSSYSLPYPTSAPSHASSAAASLQQLPRKLACPPFKEVCSVHLRDIQPEFGHMPIDFVRSQARQMAPSMQAGLSVLPSASSIGPDQITRSHSMTLALPHGAGSPSMLWPSHVLALYSSRAQKSASAMPLMTTHGLVLALHCANLPILPKSSPTGNAPCETVPLVPFGIPSPSAFPALHAFFYTEREDQLLKSMLPFPRNFLEAVRASDDTMADTLRNRTGIQSLATYLLQQSSSQGADLAEVLASHAGRVTNMWRNMVALAVVDGEAWVALDLAWEVVLAAISLAGL